MDVHINRWPDLPWNAPKDDNQVRVDVVARPRGVHTLDPHLSGVGGQWAHGFVGHGEGETCPLDKTHQSNLCLFPDLFADYVWPKHQVSTCNMSKVFIVHNLITTHHEVQLSSSCSYSVLNKARLFSFIINDCKKGVDWWGGLREGEGDTRSGTVPVRWKCRRAGRRQCRPRSTVHQSACRRARCRPTRWWRAGVGSPWSPTTWRL